MSSTTITVSEDTKKKLDEIKFVPTETYDHLINRIADLFIGGDEYEPEC